MAQRILIIDGHPDGNEQRFVHALASAYADGARAAGKEVRAIRVADLQFPLLTGNDEFLHGRPSPAIAKVQADLLWCDHLAIVFPLWLGSLPAVLKGLLEQVLRPGFAFDAAGKNGLPRKRLAGRTARVVVTMGMPAFFYRWYFGAHSLKSLERNILAFVGFRPVRSSTIGSVEKMKPVQRTAWLERMRRFAQEI